VIVDGKDVTIEAQLVFPHGAAPADMTQVRDGILSTWGRTQHGYRVSMNLSADGAPPVEVYFLQGQYHGFGGSAGRGRGGQLAIGRPNSAQRGDGTYAELTRGVAAHEWGHLMGLYDHSSRKRDVMAERYDRGTYISKDQFEQALQNCKEEPNEDEQEDEEPDA
jgi:hypothetical protein